MSAANLTYYVFLVSSPVITPASGYYSANQNMQVTITNQTDGAVVFYTTDGSDPTTASQAYSGQFNITAPATIKAIAVGTTTSSIVEENFSVHERAQPPTILPAPGTYQGSITATITTTTVGASIYYSTNGTNPTATSGILYSGPITVSKTEKIKAIAVSSNYDNSNITAASYTITELPIAPAPSITPKTGQYTTSTVVTLQTALASGVIYYTVDGTIPTVHSTHYTNPITVTEDTTINAIVIADNYKNSAITSSVYSLVAPQQSYLNIYDFKMGLRKVDSFATDKDI